MTVLRYFTICLDAGHGGTDPGAVDGKGGTDKLNTLEKDINLKVVLLLKSKLDKLGAKVILTRNKDTYPSLKERCQTANNANADIFISIHCNSGPAAADGIETLCKVTGKTLAEYLQMDLIGLTKAKNRGVKFREDLAVLNGTKMPSVLVELGFMSNDKEEVKLNSVAYQNTLTDAIVRAIVKYKKGVGVNHA